MSWFRTPMSVLLIVLVGAALVGAALVGVPAAKTWWDQHYGVANAGPSHAVEPKPRAELALDDRDTLVLPHDVAQTMGVAVTEVQPAPETEPLWLDGTLILGAEHLVHVHSRFAGDVVELGVLPVPSLAETGDSSPEPRKNRPLRFGDHVQQGQLLAVIWSKELGEKKSELVENLSRLRVEQEKLKRLEELLATGSVPERSVREAERDVDSSTIAVARAERTLRSWKLNPEEIEEIRHEAEEIRARKGHWSKEMVDKWARVEVRAPLDGTIVEKNINVGDFVASELDIFKIADLTQIDVLAHAYEEDLPALERLPADRRQWQVYVKADRDAPPMSGHFDRIGNIIDPNQHTALIMGWVDNSSGRLRVGQFVTARIDLPIEPNEVVVPVSAVVDQEGQSYVFVRDGAHADRYTRRRVHPAQRRDNLVYLRAAPHAGAGQPGPVPLKPGEQVVTVAGVELAAELQSLQAANRVTASAN